MREQLNSAFHADRPSAIQYSGPITMTPDQGVYETMGRCTHPGHVDETKPFFTTLLLPIIIVCKTLEQWLDVCCTCCNEHEQGNPKGPGGEMTGNLFRQQCRHHRFCYNARCDPRDTKIPERSQQIVDRVYNDVLVCGNDDDKKAVKIFGIQGTRSGAEDNRNGSRHGGTILDDHLDPEHRSRNLYD